MATLRSDVLLEPHWESSLQETPDVVEIEPESLKDLHKELKIHAPEFGPIEGDQVDIKAAR